MRVYLHFEDARRVATTKVDFAPEGPLRTVGDLLARFVELSNGANADLAPLHLAALTLCDETHRPLDRATPLSAVARSGEDFFVVETRANDPPPPPSPAPESQPPASAAGGPDGGSVGIVAEFVKVAGEAAATRRYAQALALLDQVLPLAPDHAPAWALKGTVCAAIGKWDRAAEAFARAARGDSDVVAAHLALGNARYEAGDFPAAVEALNTAVSAVPSAAPPPSPTTVADLKVALGRALYRTVDPEAGVALIADVVETTPNHKAALIEYSRVALDRRRYPEAVRIALNLLVNNPNDKEARRTLGRTLAQVPRPLEVLDAELGDAAHSASAHSAAVAGFLALVIKDQGLLPESAALYGRAVAGEPGNASFALNHAHTLEVLNQHPAAVHAVLDFLRRNPDGRLSYLTCRDVLAAVGTVGDLQGSAVLPTVDLETWRARYSDVRLNGDRLVLIPPEGPHPEPGLPAAAAAAGGPPPTPREFTPEELDLLALTFTLVKNLFVVGSLVHLPPLLHLLDPLRHGADLHKTLIRNEQAYFASLTQLMEALPFAELARCPTAGNLYVCGDSHSLSPSWRIVTYRGEPRRLVNALVTGLKCWHLRPESHFYPKVNFHNVVNAIPDGSQVIMVFGEIDCREGILFAVERALYRDLEEGVQATVDIYIDALVTLQRLKGFELFIHPAPPVLDVTRPTVVLFNTLLPKALHRLAHPAIRWLDFYELLLTEDRRSLRPEYALDGTHLHPRYLPLLEAALGAAAAP